MVGAQQGGGLVVRVDIAVAIGIGGGVVVIVAARCAGRDFAQRVIIRPIDTDGGIEGVGRSRSPVWRYLGCLRRRPSLTGSSRSMGTVITRVAVA